MRVHARTHTYATHTGFLIYTFFFLLTVNYSRCLLLVQSHFGWMKEPVLPNAVVRDATSLTTNARRLWCFDVMSVNDVVWTLSILHFNTSETHCSWKMKISSVCPRLRFSRLPLTTSPPCPEYSEYPAARTGPQKLYLRKHPTNSAHHNRKRLSSVRVWKIQPTKTVLQHTWNRLNWLRLQEILIC